MNNKQKITVLLMTALLCSCNTTPQNGADETAVTTAQPISVTSAQTDIADSTQPASPLFYSFVPYSKKGTGPAKPDTAPSEDYIYSYVPVADGTNHIVILKDVEIMKKINQWIDEASSHVEEKHAEYLKQTENDSRYIFNEYDMPYYVTASCKNGYLFVDVVTSSHFQDETESELDYTVPYYAESGIWDLYTGEKLELTDLFYEGTDFISHYNKCVENEIYLPQSLTGFTAITVPLKREFAGITEDSTCLSVDTVYFLKGNPYFQNGMSYYVDTADLFFRDNSVIGQMREIENLFVDAENMYISRYSWINDDNNITYSSHETVKNIVMNLIDSSTVIDDSKIEQINDLARRTAESDEAAQLAKKLFKADFDTPIYSQEGYFNGYLLYISVYKDAGIVEIKISQYMDEIGAAFYYDLDSLDRLSNSEVFRRVFGDRVNDIGIMYNEDVSFVYSDEEADSSTITGIFISDRNQYRSVNIAQAQDDFYYPISISLPDEQ